MKVVIDENPYSKPRNLHLLVVWTKSDTFLFPNILHKKTWKSADWRKLSSGQKNRFLGRKSLNKNK